MNRKNLDNLIKEVKEIVEYGLEVKFDIEIVDRHVCICKPAFGVVIIGIEFIESVCIQHSCDLLTALLLIITHEALHVKGLKHDAKGRKVGFYSDTLRDSYTPKIVATMLN